MVVFPIEQEAPAVRATVEVTEALAVPASSKIILVVAVVLAGTLAREVQVVLHRAVPLAQEAVVEAVVEADTFFTKRKIILSNSSQAAVVA
jgi:hypothetical protein